MGTQVLHPTVVLAWEKILSAKAGCGIKVEQRFFEYFLRMTYRRVRGAISALSMRIKIINNKAHSKTTANTCAYWNKLHLKD